MRTVPTGNRLCRPAAWLVLLLLFGCAGATPTGDVTTGPAVELDGKPKTLAILPFENNAVTDAEHYEPLRKGLAAMLITDLSKGGGTLKLIERSKIEALLKEIALGQTGSVDPSTAVQVGKLLGAQSIAFGSFMVLGAEVRIDVRIVKVETGELIISESISGKSDAFIELERNLAGKIAESLRVAYQPETGVSKGGIEAAVYFSNGLEALDKGDRAAAEKLFHQCVALDPAYEKQVATALEG
ncbi:MAG: CsgG/HfaB family protein [Thermodesulfobacteriota bacterium]